MSRVSKDVLAENKKKYREICANEPTIQVYIKDWWLDAVCGEDNWDVLLSYNKDSTIRGSFTLYSKKRHGIKYITTPRFCQNTGLWLNYPEIIGYEKKLSFEKEVCNDLIDQLEEYAKKYYIAFAQFALAPRYTNWLPFYWRGFKQTTKYTYRIEGLQQMTEDEITSSFNNSKRKEINRANRRNISVTNSVSINEFYEHHKSSLTDRGKNIGYDFELLNRMYSSAIQNNGGHILSIVNDEGLILCTRFFIYDAMCAYSLISSTEQDYKNEGASTRLFQECIFYTKNNNLLDCYDFEGSMIESVENSFRKFGTKQVPYHSLNKIFTKNILLRNMLKIIFY